MADNDSVSILKHLEVRILELEKSTAIQLAAHREAHVAETRAVDIARQELSLWKDTHNNLQRQIEQSHELNLKRVDFIREHTTLSKKIDAVERLVYIGVGAAMVLEVVLRWFAKN